MVSASLSDIIKDLITFINSNYNSNIPKVNFDELSTTKDSICITTAQDSKPSEKVADVTGKWNEGVVNLSITYRVMLSDKGIKDLDYNKIVDDLYGFIKSNYKLVNKENYFIDDVTQVKGSTLDTVYQGGIKDFVGIFNMVYQRRI